MQFELLMKNKKNKIYPQAGVVENEEINYPPTGDWSEVAPKVNEKCVACGQCMKFCPENVIFIKELSGKKKAEVDYRYCKGCGLCAEICPFKAIEMAKKFLKEN